MIDGDREPGSTVFCPLDSLRQLYPRQTLQLMTFRRPQSDRLLLFLSRLLPVEAGCHRAGLKLGLSGQDA